MWDLHGSEEGVLSLREAMRASDLDSCLVGWAARGRFVCVFVSSFLQSLVCCCSLASLLAFLVAWLIGLSGLAVQR